MKIVTFQLLMQSIDWKRKLSLENWLQHTVVWGGQLWL